MDTVKRIQLADDDAFQLLNTVYNFIGMTDEERERAEADEQAGKPIYPKFYTYQEYYDVLEGMKDDAKALLKNLEKQIGFLMIEDELLDEI